MEEWIFHSHVVEVQPLPARNDSAAQGNVGGTWIAIEPSVQTSDCRVLGGHHGNPQKIWTVRITTAVANSERDRLFNSAEVRTNSSISIEQPQGCSAHIARACSADAILSF